MAGRATQESGEWGLITLSHDVRPADAMGATITPAQNAYGSYATVLAGATGGPGGGATEDAFGIWLNFNSGDVSTAARDIITKVRIGGTEKILHLLASNAAPYLRGGVHYYFPLYIPGGSDIDVAASVNNATVGTLRAQCALFCRPSEPTPRYGSYVRTFGEVTASSRGTLVTPGTTSIGAYTQLGAAVATDDDLWWWQVGIGINDPSIASQYRLDLAVGDASNKRLAVLNELAVTITTEAISKFCQQPGWRRAKPGELVYGRAWSEVAADTDVSMCAYAVGG